MKKRLLQYGITTVVGALIALWVLNVEGFFIIIKDAPDQTKEIMNILCNAFFIPGLLLVLSGVLMWIASTGFFDSLGYAGRTAAHMFVPFMKPDRKSYYDYKEEKAQKRGKVPYYIMIVGAAYILVSIVFTILWYVK